VDLRISPAKVGKIVDISRGGLAFRYIDVGELSSESFELDMYSRHNEFRMENVPVRTIWDRKTVSQLGFSTRTRLRGVQFGNLTQNQFTELECFLLLNTATEEEPMGMIH
jgi:hypothetical protein